MPATANPQINIPLTITDKVIEAVGLLVLAAFWYFTLSYFDQLPDTIPTHFNTNGEVDGYGGKWTIMGLPIVGTLMYLGLTLASAYPHKLNYAVTITESNAAKQYSIFSGMLRIMKIAVLLVFFILDYQTMQIALGLPDIFGRWFLLIVFTLIFAPVFYFLIQSSKNA